MVAIGLLKMCLFAISGVPKVFFLGGECVMDMFLGMFVLKHVHVFRKTTVCEIRARFIVFVLLRHLGLLLETCL